MIAAGLPTAVQSVHDRAARLFEGGGPVASRAGVEIEVFVADAETLDPSPRADVERALRLAPSLPTLAAASFEPGGQLELSVLPAPDVRTLLVRAREALDAMDAALAGTGLVAYACGVDPRQGRMAWDLQCDGARYSVMQAHFDRVGGCGRRMMRETAALQVCVEMPRGDDGVEAWIALNAVAPALTAAFANSPSTQGDGAPRASDRIGVWLDTDASRTGFDGTQVDGAEPAAAYARFALDALAMPLPRDAAGVADGGGGGRPLREWISDGGARPDADDVDHHLTTLFPPVRPRGDYLEVRCVDSLPWRWAAVAIRLVDLIAHDATVRRVALDARVAHDGEARERWRRACESGSRDPDLASEALALLRAAEVALGGGDDRDGAHVLGDYRERFTESRRCPGDELAELLATTPEALPRWR